MNNPFWVSSMRVKKCQLSGQVKLFINNYIYVDLDHCCALKNLVLQGMCFYKNLKKKGLKIMSLLNDIP